MGQGACVQSRAAILDLWGAHKQIQMLQSQKQCSQENGSIIPSHCSSKKIMADATTSCAAVHARDCKIHTPSKLTRKYQGPLCWLTSLHRVTCACVELTSPPWSYEQHLLGTTQDTDETLTTRVLGNVILVFHSYNSEKKAIRGLEWVLGKPIPSSLQIFLSRAQGKWGNPQGKYRQAER